MFRGEKQLDSTCRGYRLNRAAIIRMEEGRRKVKMNSMKHVQPGRIICIEIENKPKLLRSSSSLIISDRNELLDPFVYALGNETLPMEQKRKKSTNTDRKHRSKDRKNTSVSHTHRTRSHHHRSKTEENSTRAPTPRKRSPDVRKRSSRASSSRKNVEKREDYTKWIWVHGKSPPGYHKTTSEESLSATSERLSSRQTSTTSLPLKRRQKTEQLLGVPGSPEKSPQRLPGSVTRLKSKSSNIDSQRVSKSGATSKSPRRASKSRPNAKSSPRTSSSGAQTKSPQRISNSEVQKKPLRGVSKVIQRRENDTKNKDDLNVESSSPELNIISPIGQLDENKLINNPQLSRMETSNNALEQLTDHKRDLGADRHPRQSKASHRSDHPPSSRRGRIGKRGVSSRTSLYHKRIYFQPAMMSSTVDVDQNVVISKWRRRLGMMSPVKGKPALKFSSSPVDRSPFLDSQIFTVENVSTINKREDKNDTNKKLMNLFDIVKQEDSSLLDDEELAKLLEEWGQQHGESGPETSSEEEHLYMELEREEKLKKIRRLEKIIYEKIDKLEKIKMKKRMALEEELELNERLRKILKRIQELRQSHAFSILADNETHFTISKRE